MATTDQTMPTAAELRHEMREELARLRKINAEMLDALKNIRADCEVAAERRTSADWDFAVTHAIEYADTAIAKATP